MNDLREMLQVFFSLITVLCLVHYVFSTVKSYNYVKANFKSLCNIFFGDPHYFKK